MNAEFFMRFLFAAVTKSRKICTNTNKNVNYHRNCRNCRIYVFKKQKCEKYVKAKCKSSSFVTLVIFYCRMPFFMHRGSGGGAHVHSSTLQDSVFEIFINASLIRNL